VTQIHSIRLVLGYCVADIGAKGKRVQRAEELLFVKMIGLVTGFMDPNGDQLRGFVIFANLRREKPFEWNVILVSRRSNFCRTGNKVGAVAA